MKNKGLLILAALFISFGFLKAQEIPETKVLINTTMGDIKVKLYNETPLHRDNFIKLVNEHIYDSLLFHRVIQSFMIQGGDPDSKNAAPGVMLGNGGLAYTVPAEFNSKLIHKKGALAGAREGDDVNPNRASSSTQFYIVQGKVFTDSDLDKYEARINKEAKQRVFSAFINKPENKELLQKWIVFQQANQKDSLQKLSASVEPLIQSEIEKTGTYKFSPEQRAAYKTIGGAPHLDSGYTVYGEVIEGIETVDKIAAVPVDQVARPLADVRILKMTIIK